MQKAYIIQVVDELQAITSGPKAGFLVLELRLLEDAKVPA